MDGWMDGWMEDETTYGWMDGEGVRRRKKPKPRPALAPWQRCNLCSLCDCNAANRFCCVNGGEAAMQPTPGLLKFLIANFFWISVKQGRTLKLREKI